MARFTQEEYEKARGVNILDYLNSNGYNIKKVGNNEYTLLEHDSIRINPVRNTFFWNSQNVGGSTIQFLQVYEGKSLVEAINILNGKSISNFKIQNKQPEKNIEIKGDVVLPKKNIDNKRVQAYLTKSRKIDFEIVNSLIKSGNIYEDKENHNIIFVGKDKDNNIKYASKRSTLTNSSFKGDLKNSDKDFGFRINGAKCNDKVYIFESAIDLMTHATISKGLGKDWKEDNRISLGCLSFKALDNFLVDNTNIKELVLFLDSDEEGLKNANKLYKNYGNDYKIDIITVKNKDLNQTWQDYLNDKESNINTKFVDYIKYLDKPFLEPKILDNKERLKNHLENMLDINFDYIDKEKVYKNLLENLFEKEDRKAVFLIKDEKGQSIGGYEWDIYNKDYKLNLLNKGVEKPLFFKSIENSECVFLYDNIVSTLAMNTSVNTCYVNNIDNLDNIDNVIKDNKGIDTIFLFVDKNTKLYKEYQNQNSQIYKDIKAKENQYNIKIGIEDWSKDSYKGFIKKNYIKDKFIPKQKGDSNELYQTLLQKTNIPKQRLLELFRNNVIYQDIDKNMVFLIKDEKGQDVGGYELNINSKKPEIKKLENTYISKEQEEETLNLATYIFKDINGISNTLGIEKNLEIEL
ncbi:DUF3991 and TOPRIM domain-containing protein [uncultured Tyzzerella sp.]|uniref:DUF3991 and TOPRIM domain-containing protein n=1 Tax=uncultured Tyzzerella sp. TaxID=2321398 RepID=UPI002942A6E4|nr:DUF3991 and TOPRIM domain-containing protein [uncultured Tyzzerella sp.]